MKVLKNKKGFTMIEMLIVLLIVSVLSLLIIPNINTTRKKVNEEGQAALTQVIQTQFDLYKFEYGEASVPTLADLQEKGYISQEQIDKAGEWELTFQ